MARYIALLRGINVGGKNLLPMESLRKLLEGIGCENVRTYIQSGNVVFDSQSKSASGLSRRIRDCVNEQFCFDAAVIVITPSELESAITNNPFADAISTPSAMHYFFLEKKAKSPDLHRIDSTKGPSERCRLIGKVLYLHAPDGIGRSKLAAIIPKLMDVSVTARNHRTVAKLVDMATARGG